MELKDILTVAFASLIVLVVAHLAVFWVVKTLYPPTAPPQVVPTQVVQIQEPVKTVTFTEPPIIEQQNVTIPTYETPLPSQTPNQETEPPVRQGPPPAESTSIRGKSGVDVSNSQ
jgi:hypothetical protein